MSAHTTTSRILQRLENVTATATGWSARCPVHDDGKNSLCVSEGDDGRVLMCCQAGCETPAIVSALGLKMSDLFAPAKERANGSAEIVVARYDYRDETGLLLFQTVRFQPKDFRQRAPDGNGGWNWRLNGARRVLYRLPDLLASDPAAIVFIVEGEKDVDRLRSLGLIATCNVGGAGKWRDEYGLCVDGRTVVIVPDNDDPGRAHAEQVAKSVSRFARSVKVLALDGLPPKGDVSDWLDAGHSADELRALAEAAPDWKPGKSAAAQLRAQKPTRPDQSDNEFPLTDLGNTRRLIAEHGADLRYCHPWKQWLVWDGTRWKPDDTGEVLRRAKAVVDAMYVKLPSLAETDRKELWKHLQSSSRKERIAGMVSLAQSEPGVPVLPQDLDYDAWLLNCPNGTLDLRTGKLKPHDRRDMITKVTAAAFNPEAPTYDWDRFLEDVLDGNGELIEFVQRLFGYSLTATVAEHVLAVFYGKGANGKSTLLEAVMGALGPDYAAKAAPDLLLVKHNDTHPTERADLYGKRLIAAVESDNGRRLHESLVKELTGGDTVKARRMREDFWSFRPTWKIILCTNHRPTIRGTDEGIWRRIRLVPFGQIFEGERQDPRLPEKLAAMAEGVLAWAVEGCRQWQAQGLGQAEAVREATQAYRREQDVIGLFIAERCSIDATAEVKARDLRNAYEEWAAESGMAAINPNRFGKELAERGYERFTRNGTWYRGIRLSP